MAAVGGPADLVAAVKAAGRAPGPTSKWLGAWSLGKDLAEWDAFFRGCKAAGSTPQVNAWLFGASMNLVSNPAEAQRRVDLLAAVMAKAKAAGAAPWVMLEPEAAIPGSAAYAAYWDRLLAAVRACPGAKVYWCPGVWVDHAAFAAYYARQVAAADGVGLQSVKFEPRHGVAGIRTAVTELQAAFQAYPAGKPRIIYDVLWSTYGGQHASTPPFAGGDGRALEDLQAAMLRQLAAAAPGMGVDVVVYRALRDDPAFDVGANYGGWAERFAGVVRADGSPKPGFPQILALAGTPAAAHTEGEYQAVADELAAIKARVRDALRVLSA